MTRGKIAMPAMKWLATLGLALLLPAAHATTAVVFSESTGRWGVAWNEPGKDEAIRKATEDCRYRGGGKDCKPIKVSDEPGFGAVAQTCAGGYCGISIISGRRSAADAERDAVSDCNKQYGVNNCYALDRWQETSAVSVAKADVPTATPPATSSAPRVKNEGRRGDNGASGQGKLSSLVNTRWIVEYGSRDTHHAATKFLADGKCILEAGYGSEKTPCQWSANGNNVEVVINNGYATLNGKKSGSRISGKARNVSGETWDFSWTKQ